MNVVKSLESAAELIKHAYVDKQIAKLIHDDVIRYLRSSIGKQRAKLEYPDVLIQEINAIISYHSKDLHFMVTLANRQVKLPIDNIKVRDHYICIRTMENMEVPEIRHRLSAAIASISEPLILDLRGCVGGSANTLYFLLCHFIPDGKPMFRRSTDDDKFTVTSGSIIDDMDVKYKVKKYTDKLDVIVNSWTYSAGELFAAVIQAQKRGKIYGSQTVGMTNLTKYERFGAIQLHIPYCETLICQPGQGDRKIENIGVIPDYLTESKEYIQLVYKYLGNITLKNYVASPPTK